MCGRPLGPFNRFDQLYRSESNQEKKLYLGRRTHRNFTFENGLPLFQRQAVFKIEWPV